MREHSRNIKRCIMPKLVYFGTVYWNQCQSWRRTDEGTWKSRMHHTRGARFMSGSSQCKTKDGFQDGHALMGNRPVSLTRGQRITIHLSVLKQIQWAQIRLKRQQHDKTQWKPLHCGFSRSHDIWGGKGEWYSTLHSSPSLLAREIINTL